LRAGMRGGGKKNCGAHSLEGEWRAQGMEGLQEWRVGGRIWRGMQNIGLFRGPAGVRFSTKTSKFWSRCPYGGPHWSCANVSFDCEAK
jgi:hypothetical protein